MSETKKRSEWAYDKAEKYGKKIQWESRMEGMSHMPITSPVIFG